MSFCISINPKSVAFYGSECRVLMLYFNCTMINYLIGDCKQILKTLPEKSVHCCVTSPPYWGLRDYGSDEQIGLEESPERYVQDLVEVFREVRRVLQDDGTLWLNLGDSYAAGKIGRSDEDEESLRRRNEEWGTARAGKAGDRGKKSGKQRPVPKGLKPKDLVGIPWRVAFALQADGWYLRSDVIWHKPNAMPDSVQDRPTKAHEYIFLLTKSERYYYDIDAIREPFTTPGAERNNPEARKVAEYERNVGGRSDGFTTVKRPKDYFGNALGRNKRTVWSIATAAYSGAHFATYPPELIRPCILAGCPVGGTVLDPFGGSGTTALVAEQEGRNAILIELNAEYMELAKQRTQQASLLAA